MTSTARKPDWLKRRLPRPGQSDSVTGLLTDLRLNTVCQEAMCPNCGECFSQGTATFLLLGPNCTRNCAFCAVGHGQVTPPDMTEPDRVAQAVARLHLTFAVLTMVTRDDLPDGGAAHVSRTIAAIRQKCPDTGVEVLISDLRGDRQALAEVLDARPEVLNHNLETIPRLYPEVRPQARFDRSLQLLERASARQPRPVVKSGLMLGLGEEKHEVVQALRDLRSIGCDSITLGQYLAPSKNHHPVIRYVPPPEFEEYADVALSLGFTGVAGGPYVRSSYHAEELFKKAKKIG